MNKENYIEKLLYYMEERDFDQESIDEIIEDYSMMIDEALESDVEEENLENYLGDPREIIKNIRKTIVYKRVKNSKFVALSPFIALILFFTLGFGFSYWTYGWLVFLLVPISGILSSRKQGPLKFIIDIVPILAIVVFLSIGLTSDIWHPTWLVFLLIPAVSILDKKSQFKVLYFLFFLGLIGLYLLSFFFFPFNLNWAILLLLFIPAFRSSMFTFTINGARAKSTENSMFLLLVFVTITYLILGSTYGIWHPLWLIFLLIPIGAIFLSNIKLKQKQPLVAYMPFIAVILFILAGEIFGGYRWSWLFFLIIPMTAIIKEK